MANALTVEEKRALLDQPNTCYPVELRNRLILSMPLKVGLCLSELTSLRWNQVDLNMGRITIHGNNRMTNRSLKIPDDTVELMAQWYEQQQREWEKRACRYNPVDEPTGCVFTTLRGKKVKRPYIRNMIERNASGASIERTVNYQTLRRTFAWELYQETKNWHSVRRKLGHEKVITTVMFLFGEISRRCVLPDRISSGGDSALPFPADSQAFSTPLLKGMDKQSISVPQ